MPEGLKVNLFIAQATTADSIHVDTTTKTYVKYVITMVGFTGTVDLMGQDGVTGPLNVLYLQRDATDDTYAAASVAQMSYTTETSTQIAVVVGESWVEQWVEMTRNAGTISIDMVEVGSMPLQFTTAEVTVESLTVGAVTIANGADATQGAVANSANTDPTASATVNSNLKGLLALLNPPGAPTTGHKAVTTSGTQVRLVASTTPCRGVLVTADVANTGKIYVGASNIDAATFLGNALAAGQTLSFPINDATDLWLDCTVNGEGVGYNIIPL